jgi:hypothetical protein
MDSTVIYSISVSADWCNDGKYSKCEIYCTYICIIEDYDEVELYMIYIYSIV